MVTLHELLSEHVKLTTKFKSYLQGTVTISGLRTGWSITAYGKERFSEYHEEAKLMFTTHGLCIETALIEANKKLLDLILNEEKD